MELKEIVKTLEQEMACNCDLDNWQPEKLTGHSWVCRIHRAAMRKRKPTRQEIEEFKWEGGG